MLHKTVNLYTYLFIYKIHCIYLQYLQDGSINACLVVNMSLIYVCVFIKCGCVQTKCLYTCICLWEYYTDFWVANTIVKSVSWLDMRLARELQLPNCRPSSHLILGNQHQFPDLLISVNLSWLSILKYVPSWAQYSSIERYVVSMSYSVWFISNMPMT